MIKIKGEIHKECISLKNNIRHLRSYGKKSQLWLISRLKMVHLFLT